MKRLLTIGLMLASAFALTNCAEEITAPVQEDVNVDGNIENITPPEEEVDIPFEVFANLGESPETKTYNWGNGTYWHKYEKAGDDPSDQISVFHHDGSQFTHNNAFTIQDVATSLFTGSLRNELGNTNDWYFLYPYNKDYTINSSSGTTATTAFSIPSINIGSATYTQDSAEGQGKKHIAGKNFPMFGFVGGLEVDHNPDIKMNHLAAIAAVKVVNLTDDIITLNNAELHTYKTVVENNKSVKKTLPVVGNFKVGFDNDGNPIEFTAVSGNSNQVKIQLDEPVPVKPNASYTLYFAVSPFKTTLQNLTLYINGSEKIPASTDEVVFEAGKVTTLKLNIDEPEIYRREEGYYDALNLKWTDKLTGNKKKIVSIYDGPTTGTPINYNGSATINNIENIPIYKLGAGKAATIKIEGTVKEMINALPLGFYASRWNSLPTAMTIKRIDLLLPKEYDETGSWYNKETDYSKLISRETLNDKFGGMISLASWGLGLLGITLPDIDLSDGITLDLIKSIGIQESTIAFSGMIPNCSFNDTDIASSNVLMLDEERTHKEMSDLPGGNVESYLKRMGKDATIQGLKDILNLPYDGTTVDWTDAATTTGTAIYNKVKALMTSMMVSKGLSQELASKAVDLLIKSYYSEPEILMYHMRDMVVTLEIETRPYGNSETYNPIVFWGFHCVAPEAEN